MGFSITPQGERSKLVVFIDYQLPPSGFSHWLALLFGRAYAAWCTRRMVSDAMTAFSELKSTPEFFRRYLNRYLTHAELGASMALVYTADQVFSAANFADTWSALLPADQQVLKLLVRGVRDLHSENTRTQLGVSLGLGKAATKNTPQQALQRLQDAGIVAKLDHGHYQLQDDAMAEWLRSLDLDG